ncbi:hypothetical protein EV714DRAFT_272931 [Schizophyllum commune]
MPLMRLIPTSHVVEAYNTARQNPLSRAPIAALPRPERASKRRSRGLAALVKRLRVTENDLRDRSGIPLVFWLGHTVFPSLASLVVDKCKDFGNDHVALLRQLLPLNLHAIDIGGVNRYSWDLASSFPSLRDLFIDGNIELERVYPWRFTTLTRVKLAIRYSTELMEALARFCPALRAVSLDLRDDSIVHELSLGGGESFPALQHLSLSGVSSAFLMQSILEVLPCRYPMEEIRVHHASISHLMPAADDYLSILTKINQFCDPSALRTLVVFARKPTDISPYPTDPTSYLHLIAPLSGLLKLSLISWHGLKFSDADCVKFPSYWPHIRFLWLCNLDLGSNPLTLAALLPFAEMCANLVTLGLVLDARATPPEIQPSLSPSSTLIYLGMFTSPIARKGVDGVARFIAALFPKLRSVCASSASPYKPIWDEVSAKLSRGPSVPSEEGSYAGETRTPQLRNRRGEYREGGNGDKPHANVEATGMSSDTPVARQGITESPVRAGDDRTSNSVRAPSIQADADIASQPPTSGPSSPGSTRQRLAELEQRNSVLEKQNSALEKARAKLERRYNTMEDRLDMEINNLQQRNSDLVRDLAEANKQKEVLARELKETEAHYESQEKRLLALEHSIKAETEMARAIEAVRQERDELSWRLTSVCRERDEYANRYEALEHHADEVQASYEDAERRVLEMTADRASVHQALADLALRTSGMPGTAQ